MSANLTFEKKFGFKIWPSTKIDKAFTFAEDYRKFISQNKTEREVVSSIVKEAQKAGFVELESDTNSKDIKADKSSKGVRGITEKIYGINRGKSLILGIFGKKPLKSGIKLILAHIDSPRFDLKPMPIYESEKVAWMKTQYYGGVKKYQWPALPLAIHGVIVLANGKEVMINMGENEAEPVLSITDLLPHLAKEQMEKKMEEAVEAEDMNLIIGSMPTKVKSQMANGKDEIKDKVKMGVLELLNKKYGITEEDFVSADLEIVPAGAARDVGFDASMIGGYGQDDRVCAYTAFKAMLNVSDPEESILLVLTDKEETGSESNTGALSSFIPDFISEMIFMQEAKHDENILRDCLSYSKAISADVTVAFDPDYPMVFDPKNTARLGAGIAIEKYTGGRGKSGTSEASAEYLAKIRKIFNQNEILWQTGGLGKSDMGGGGTIAMFLARYNMDVIDAGPAILSMHSPMEIVSKADLYACFEAYKAFFGKT